MRCSKCQEKKTKNEMSVRDAKAKTDSKKYKTYCKSCASKITKQWKNKLSDEEKQQKHKTAYSKRKEKLKYDLDYSIRHWTSSCKKRQGKRFEGRKNLSTEHIVQLCYEALEKFPYISFFQGKEKYQTPSLDRIDNSIPYSDDNVRVIPLWLNSAKLDMTDDKLNELILHYMKEGA